jgi:hypothetical protein
MVVTTVWQNLLQLDAGNVNEAFKRNRAPMGGHCVLA